MRNGRFSAFPPVKIIISLPKLPDYKVRVRKLGLSKNQTTILCNIGKRGEREKRLTLGRKSLVWDPKPPPTMTGNA